MPKCIYCKKFVDLDVERVIMKKSGKSITWCHYDCFVEHKLNMKNRKPLEDIKKEAEEKYKLTLEYLDEKRVKDELYKFIQNMYNIVVLPNYFFVKMDAIYKGTYKGLAKGIPAYHLLDMWRQKQQYLIRVYNNNVSKGKQLEGIDRVNYDLAILLNLYDGYLKWRNSIEAQSEQEHTVITQHLAPKIKTKIVPDSKSGFDIDKELDEI